MTTLIESESRQALDLWRNITSETIRSDGPDLTSRQTALLLTIHLDEEHHTVRGLAKRLGLQKPAIVRALDALQSMDLIKRVRDPNDGRNVFIEPTSQGAHKLGQIASSIAQNLSALQMFGIGVKNASKEDAADTKTNYQASYPAAFDASSFNLQELNSLEAANTFR